MINLLSGVDGPMLTVDQYFSSTRRTSDLNYVSSSKDLYNLSFLRSIRIYILGKHGYWIFPRSVSHQNMFTAWDFVVISYIIEGGDMCWFNTAASRSHVQSCLLFE